MRRGKKSVVRVAKRVAPLVPVQGLPSFFSNMYCLFDPSGTFVGFSVQNSGGRPIDHVVVVLHAQPHVRPIYCHVTSLS